MKKLLPFIAFLFLSLTIFAQTPYNGTYRIQSAKAYSFKYLKATLGFHSVGDAYFDGATKISTNLSSVDGLKGALTIRNTQAYGFGGVYTQHPLVVLNNDGTSSLFTVTQAGQGKFANSIFATGYANAAGTVLAGVGNECVLSGGDPFGTTGFIRFYTKQPSLSGVEMGKMSELTKNFYWGTLPGATDEITSSKFTVISTTQGSIPAPIMTTTERDAISSPAEGLQIYNITTHTINFWNGSVWKAVTTD